MSIKMRLKTPTEVRRALAKVANMTANGEMDTKTANTIIWLVTRFSGQSGRMNSRRKLMNLRFYSKI